MVEEGYGPGAPMRIMRAALASCIMVLGQGLLCPEQKGLSVVYIYLYSRLIACECTEVGSA